MKYILIAAIVFFVACSNDALADESNGSTVSVDLYYESLCYDSIQFVKNQLKPTFDSLGDYINITFIPYGKATHSRNEYNQWQFDCQHGAAECRGNKAQSCGINVISNSEFSPEDPVIRQRLLVNLIACVMSKRNPATAVPQCAETIGLKEEARAKINECVDSSLGDDLLASYGDKTHSLQPVITFVPTIVINGVFTQENQRKSLVDFKTVVCQHISNEDKPSAC